MLKAQNYDADIAEASKKAAATALNDKVQNGLRNFGSGVPTLGSSRSGQPKEKKKGGTFAEFGTE